MDPQKTMQRIADAYSASEWEECRDAADDLRHWIDGGGYVPMPTNYQMAALLDMVIDQAEACHKEDAAAEAAIDAAIDSDERSRARERHQRNEEGDIPDSRGGG